MAPLQRLTVKPIEDPAEQAALDELLKRCEESIAVGPSPEQGNREATGDALDESAEVPESAKRSKPSPPKPSPPPSGKRRRG